MILAGKYFPINSRGGSKSKLVDLIISEPLIILTLYYPKIKVYSNFALTISIYVT